MIISLCYITKTVVTSAVSQVKVVESRESNNHNYYRLRNTEQVDSSLAYISESPSLSYGPYLDFRISIQAKLSNNSRLRLHVHDLP